MKKFFFFLLISGLTLPVSSFANATPELSGIDAYLAKADKKFDRAAINFTSGWTEIIRQARLQYKSSDSKKKAFLKGTAGAFTGFFTGLLDAAGGFLNIATSPIPQFEIPLPHGGIQTAEITGGNPETVVPKNFSPVSSSASKARKIQKSS